MKPEIYALLLELGIRPPHMGFFFLAYALSVSSSSDAGDGQTAEFCGIEQIASHFGTSTLIVRKRLGRALNIAWRENSTDLIRLSGGVISQKPSIEEFITILSASLWG